MEISMLPSTSRGGGRAIFWPGEFSSSLWRLPVTLERVDHRCIELEHKMK